MPDEHEIGYAEAMAEIEQILETLEGSEPDVDALADSVERAAELISVCRARITAAELKVEQVTAALDDSAEEQPAEESHDE